MSHTPTHTTVSVGDPEILKPFDKMACWLAFTPDGSHLVVAGFGPTQILRTEGWAPVAELRGHTQAVAGGAISADGSRLATSSSDATIRLWSLPDGAELDTLSLHKKTVAAVAFSPDGALLASGSYDARVALYDLAAGSLRALLKGHQGNVVSLAFSPDGNRLASGGLGDEVLVWGTSAGAEGAPLLRLGGHDTVAGVWGWRNGALVTSDYVGVLREWEGESGALKATTQLDMPTVGQLSFSPDGSLAAAVAPHTVTLLRTGDWETLESISLPIKGVYSATWSTDGALLAVGGADGRVRIYPIVRS
jgi:WD40 repeat protein